MQRWIAIEVTETIQKETIKMPWWNKYTLSVQEAAEYFGFSDKKIRRLLMNMKQTTLFCGMVQGHVLRDS